MTANYRATDTDLPEIFWPEGEAPEPQPVNAALRAQLAVELHYAPIEEARQRKRYERAIQSERRATVQELDNGKHYIKGRKREEMWEWLQVLADQDAIGRMSCYEVDFFVDLLYKFGKYYPRVKWITERQYRFLNSIAGKYLQLPEAA